MSRTKYHVEYPLAQTLKEAIEFMKNGGEVWQECSDDFPSCGGFDDIECLKENFPEEDYKEDEDCQELSLHLVPAVEENVEPFRVGETVWVIESYFPIDEAYMHAGDCANIIEVSSDGKLIRLDSRKHKEVWWNVDKFCKCVLAIYSKKVYVLIDWTKSGHVEEVYEDLDFLKQECEEDVLWTDECNDIDKELELLGIADKYSGTNWDIEGIDKKTCEVRYGVNFSSLRTR